MHVLNRLFEKNRKWSQGVAHRDPEFFTRLSHQQAPDYLWIGCADSRVPPNQIVGLGPGELFEHRNIANMVVHTDLNCLSVVQYAVDALKVQHVIICGHYGCGGVTAALGNKEFGLIDNWLRHIQEVRDVHAGLLARIEDPSQQSNKLSELNVVYQVANVCRTTIVRDAWRRGQELSVHGLIYRLVDGGLLDLNLCVSREQDVKPACEATIARLSATLQ